MGISIRKVLLMIKILIVIMIVVIGINIGECSMVFSLFLRLCSGCLVDLLCLDFRCGRKVADRFLMIRLIFIIRKSGLGFVIVVK